MCILFIAVEQHPDYPLVIAANRDEFFARPTQPSHWWHDSPAVLAGMDNEAGGTWMGINKTGYLAALTNIRDPHKTVENPISRGKLVSDYLIAPKTDYNNTLQEQKLRFNGYNLLFGHWRNLSVYNNHLDSLAMLTKGVYGLSNANLNSPWPKITTGTQRLALYCKHEATLDNDALFTLLHDKTKASDETLPQTGVPLEWERKLSSIFIQGEEYGTRSSTILKIDQEGLADWSERTFNNAAHCINEKNLQFRIK